MRKKSWMAIFLTLCMMVSLMPTFTLPAAAVSSDTDIGSMNALDALGIDTSTVPDGVDLNSLDNPYGRNTATVNPVYELFVQGADSSTLYGNKKAVGNDVTFADFYGSQNDSSAVVIGSYAATATASGNFTEDSAGDKGQTVTVAAGALNKNGGLYLYFANPATGAKSLSAKTLLGTAKIIGNTGNQMDEDFSSSPYLMQNYLKIAVGDFDGDGIDEVAVYVAEQGASRVEVYDLQVPSGADMSSLYLDSSKWEKSWTYSFNESPYVSNMVSLTSGDFNQDGIDDLALTWGYYYGADNCSNSQAVILRGAKNGIMTAKSIDLSYDNSRIVRAAFTYGDIDGDNVDDLILGGQLNSDIAAGNLNTRFVAVYNYNGDDDAFVQSVAKNFDLFAKQKNDAGEYVYVYPVMQDHNDVFYSLPAMVADVAAVNMLGVGRSSDIYLDSLIIEYGNDGLDILAALDNNTDFNKYAQQDYHWVRDLDGRFYTEYGVTSADFTGDTKQTLQVMLNYDQESYTHNVTINLADYYTWMAPLFGDFYTIDTGIAETFALGQETDMVAVEGLMTENTDGGGNVIGYSFDANFKNTPVSFATSFCKLNCDNDTSYINYTGEHGVVYSDPKVLAVIASPPYFNDLSSGNLSGSYMESATSYASTAGSGTDTSKSNTLSVGGYVSYSHDIEFAGKKLASREFELSYTHGWTWETTESSMVEMTVSYETVAGQDSVAFYSIPMEYYIYDSYVPVLDSDGNVDHYDTQKMSVNLPHTAAVSVLALDKYEQIAADYSELPQISGTVLTHTVGDPSTYPASSKGYSNVTEYDGNYAGVDFSSSGASVSQEIAITDENGSGLTQTNSLDFQIGAGPFDFVFGVSAGYEHESNMVTISSVGSTYSGTVYNMPAEAEGLGYYYAWKLFTYTYTIGDNTFPVVDYLVKDVTSPPSLPENFAQDSTLTTDSAIGFTWSCPADSAVSGFQLYRYYTFPDGSGSYELAFVPASQVSYVTYDDDGEIIRHYQYVDSGLADYTDYDYQIQAIRQSVPPESIISDVLTARTKAAKGYPTITLNGVVTNETPTYDENGAPAGTTTDESLLVYPDTSSTVSVSVAETYDETPRYQWQKLGKDGWTDISGATGVSYTFKNSGLADEGQYRCRVNVIYEDEDVGQIYYITAYSDQFTLNYSMRTPEVTEGGYIADSVQHTVSLTLKPKSSNFAPTGDVTFHITGADYNASFTTALGQENANHETTATLYLCAAPEGDTSGNTYADLPDGVYEITAYYKGSRVFGSLTTSDSVYYVAGSDGGYLLNMDSSFTYGDTIAPALMQIDLADSAVQVHDNLTYKVYEQKLVTHTVVNTVILHPWLIGTIYWKYITTYTTYDYVDTASLSYPFVQGDGSITARKIGAYRVDAYVDGNMVASSSFTVNPREITIGFTDGTGGTDSYPMTKTAGSSEIVQPTYAALTLTSGELQYGDVLGGADGSMTNFGLVVKAYDSAGTENTLSSVTNPGAYTIIGAPGAGKGADYDNYHITFIPSTYTLTGPKYDMTLISKTYGSDNAIVGTVEITNPEVKDNLGNRITMATTPTNNTWYQEKAFSGGTSFSFCATPQTGYQVKDWVVKAGDIETVYTLTNPNTFLYTSGAENTTVTVEYALAQNKLYFKSAKSDGTDGTVTVVGDSIQSGAIVQPGAEYTFKANPAEGYHFVEWTLKSGGSNSNFPGNYSEENGYTATLTMQNVSSTILDAVFARDSYKLTLDGNLQASYEITGDSGDPIAITKTGPGDFTVVGDTNVTVTAKAGYELVSDAAWNISGSAATVSEDKTSCTFAITADTPVSVGTSQGNYNVSVQLDGAANNAIRVMTPDQTNTYSTNTGFSVDGGSAVTFTAAPAWGYVFDHWIINGDADHPVTGKTYIVSALGANMTVQAEFIENPDVYSVHISNNSGGNLTYSVLYNGIGYSGNAPANAPAAAAGTDITAYRGDTVVISAAPDANHMLRSWTVGDDVNESPDTTLTLENLSSDTTVAARFVSKSFTTVTYGAAESGSGDITSATADGVAFATGDSVGNGALVVLTATPLSGKTVSHWTVGGETVKTADGTDFIGETLTIPNLTAGASLDIRAYFADLSQQTITYDLTHATVTPVYSPKTYTGKTPSTETTDSVQTGSNAVITAQPETGYRITSFAVHDGSTTADGMDQGDGTWSYTNPNVTANLTVTVTAEKLYNVTEDSNIQNGGIAVDKETAIAGETVTLGSVSPALDYSFDDWSYSYNDGTDHTTTPEGTTFTMPAADTTVSANFSGVPTVAIAYSVYDTNGSEAGGTNGSISAAVDRRDGGGQSMSGYPVTDTSGSLTVNRGYTDAYAAWPDSITTFTATPDPGYMVKYWYVNGVKVAADSANLVIGSNTLTLTAVQASENTYDIQVQYELLSDKITFSAGEHGAITGGVLTDAYDQPITVNSGDTLTVSGTITFTAAPDSGYQVAGWYINGTLQNGETGTNYDYTTTVGIGANVTVEFERVSYTVAYSSASGGTMTAKIGENPIGVSPASVVGDSGVTFTASANAGFAFAGWTVNSTNISDPSNPLTLPITDNTTVTARFAADSNCAITYCVLGTGGTLTSKKSGLSFTSGDMAAANNIITFTAAPETVASGGTDNYHVVSWTVGGTVYPSNSTTYSLTVQESTDVSVTFGRYDWVVTYGVDDINGALSASVNSTGIASASRVETGKSVTFTATPASGYQVKSWKVDGVTTLSENTTHTIDNISADTTVSVAFEPIPTYTVTITTGGTGYGSVTAQVDGGPAVPNTASATVSRHGTVRLTALRYDTSNAFNGWTVPSDVDYTADGIVLTLNDVTGDITIDAAFTPAKMATLSASAVVQEGESTAHGTLDYGNVQVGYRSAGLMNNLSLPETGGKQITSGMDVTIKAVPDSGYMVKEWRVNGVAQNELSKTLNLSGVSADTDIQIVYEPLVTYAIPDSGDSMTSGGHYTIMQGTKLPDDVGSLTEIRDRGTVTFTVAANEGSYFTDLTICGVDCLTQTGIPEDATQNIVASVKNADGSYTVTVANVKQAIASDIRAVRPIVNISTPANGMVTVTYVDGDGITREVTDGTEVPVGTAMTVAATPNAGYFLKAWGGDMTGKNGTTVHLTAGTTETILISADFEQPVVTITTSSNGTVTATYMDGETQTVVHSGDKVPTGTKLYITGTTDTGYRITWGGDAAGKSGMDITLDVPAKDITISASFSVPIIGGGGEVGGGSSSNDTGGQISVQSVTNSDGSTSVTATISSGAAVSGNTASASLDADMETDLIAQISAAENATSSSGAMNSTIAIDATASDHVTSTTVELPVSTIRSVVDETSATMTFMTNTAQVILDQTALSAIADQASDNSVTLSVMEVDKNTLPQDVQQAIGDAYVLDLTVSNSGGTISSFNGGTATVRVPVPEGMLGEEMKVVYIADDGTLVETTGSIVVVDGMEYYDFTTGHFSLYALMENTAMSFTDVKDGDWYYSAVNYVYKNNLINGTTTTTFSPDMTTTRGMLVTILWRLAGEPDAAGGSFIDVTDGIWYGGAVAWAAEINIVNGMGNGLFVPEGSVTREQMAVILYNYAKHMGYDISTVRDLSGYSDSGKTSIWAVDAMKWAVGAGLISGKGNGMLDPAGNATRAEVTTILMRFIETVK